MTERTIGQCILPNRGRREEQATTTAVEEQAREAARERQRQAVFEDPAGSLARVGVPPRWQGASLDACPDLPGSLVAWLARWAERPGGLVYLVGPPGAGKTWAAAAALHRVLALPIIPIHRCRFIAERDYLDGLKAGFDSPRRPGRGDGDAFAGVRLLIVDDLLSARATSWTVDAIAGLIERRHADNLATLITGNLALAEIAGKVDARLASRLADDGQVHEFPAHDLRLCGSLRKLTT